MALNDLSTLKEELFRTIGGYLGYQNIEARLKSDKIFRRFVADKMSVIKHDFLQASGRMNHAGKYRLSDSLNKLIGQIDNLIHCLSESSKNRPEFFAHAEVDRDTLEKLYSYDSQLTTNLDILKDESFVLTSNEEDSELRDCLNHLFDILDNLNLLLIEREYIIQGGKEDTV